MSRRQTFILAHSTARNRAMHAIAHAPDGDMVTIQEPAKKRIQEEKYHAMIGDIAKECTHIGRKWDTESWKRLLVDMFADEMRAAGTPLHHDGHVVPSLDGRRIVQLGIQTREFRVREAAQFIEFLYAYGDDQGVTWSECYATPASAQGVAA
jgi:hypothetical protein